MTVAVVVVVEMKVAEVFTVEVLLAVVEWKMW